MQKKPMNKKGISDVIPMLMSGVIGLLFITMVLFVSSQVTVSLQDTNTTATLTLSNTTIPATAVSTVSNYTLPRFNVVNTTVIVGNATGNLGVEEYFIYPATGQFIITNSTRNASALNITYNYTASTLDTAYNVSNLGQTGLTNIGNQLGLYGIIIVMAAILTIVLGYFFLKGRNA